MTIKDSTRIEHIIEAATEAISFLGDKSEAIWNTIKYDLPPLLQEIKKINVED